MNYRKLYLDLVQVALSRNGTPRNSRGAPIGLESHHIIPESWGGANHRLNRVWFTYREHAFAHYLLYKIGVPVDVHTYMSMSKNLTLNTREIGEIRKEAAIKSRLRRVLFAENPVIKTAYVPSKPTSGFYGVYFSVSSKVNPYVSYCSVGGYRINIGKYPTTEAAAIDYDIAVIQLFGPDHWCRNFPDKSLIELRRMMLAYRVPVVKPKPEPKSRAWSEERKAAAKGRERSDETRAKMAWSEERKAIMRAYHLGRKISEETRAKMSAAQIGKKHSEETRAKMSAAAKLRPTKPHSSIYPMVCPHCSYSCLNKKATKYHFDNCRKNPDRPAKAKIEKVKELPVCPHCDKSGLYDTFKNFHFDNCKNHPDRIAKAKCAKAPCPHCGKFYSLQYLITHADKCKCKPAEAA